MNKTFNLKSLFFLLLLCSCKYKSTEIGSKSVYIEIVSNQTLAPQLGAFVSNKIRDQIIRRGHYLIRSDIQDCDYILQVTLIDYSKGTEIYKPADTLLAAGFRMSIQANVSLTKRSGKVLFNDTSITEHASVLRDNSLSVPSDRQALRSISQSLGQQISQLIENYRW